jgi:hypothetical protein
MDILSGVFEERFHYKKIVNWENKFELAYKILEFYSKNIEDKDIFVYRTILGEEKIDALTDTFVKLEKKSKALHVYQGLYGKEDISKPCITKDNEVCKYLLKDEITKLVKNTINEVF